MPVFERFLYKTFATMEFPISGNPIIKTGQPCLLDLSTIGVNHKSLSFNCFQNSGPNIISCIISFSPYQELPQDRSRLS